MNHKLFLLLGLLPLAAAHAGGSNYGITPGAHPNLAGKVSEWPVPTPQFAPATETVSLIRERTGLGLKEAKDLVGRMG